jgi:hypothetical protein
MPTLNPKLNLQTLNSIHLTMAAISVQNIVGSRGRIGNGAEEDARSSVQFDG